MCSVACSVCSNSISQSWSRFLEDFTSAQNNQHCKHDPNLEQGNCTHLLWEWACFRTVTLGIQRGTVGFCISSIPVSSCHYVHINNWKKKKNLGALQRSSSSSRSHKCFRRAIRVIMDEFTKFASVAEGKAAEAMLYHLSQKWCHFHYWAATQNTICDHGSIDLTVSNCMIQFMSTHWLEDECPFIHAAQRQWCHTKFMIFLNNSETQKNANNLRIQGTHSSGFNCSHHKHYWPCTLLVTATIFCYYLLLEIL
jgi:hypothetical protein